jgi:hypothetical protein
LNPELYEGDGINAPSTSEIAVKLNDFISFLDLTAQTAMQSALRITANFQSPKNK